MKLSSLLLAGTALPFIALSATAQPLATPDRAPMVVAQGAPRDLPPPGDDSGEAGPKRRGPPGHERGPAPRGSAQEHGPQERGPQGHGPQGHGPERRGPEGRGPAREAPPPSREPAAPAERAAPPQAPKPPAAAQERPEKGPEARPERKPEPRPEPKVAPTPKAAPAQAAPEKPQPPKPQAPERVGEPGHPAPSPEKAPAPQQRRELQGKPAPTEPTAPRATESQPGEPKAAPRQLAPSAAPKPQEGVAPSAAPKAAPVAPAAPTAAPEQPPKAPVGAEQGDARHDGGRDGNRQVQSFEEFEKGHIDQLRGQRRERKVDNGRVTVIEEPGDRTIVREGDRVIIRHDETDRFRRTYRDADVRVERRGADRVTVVRRPNGTEIVTIEDDNGHLLRRVRREASGREVVLIDNSRRPRRDGYFVEEVVNLPPPVVRIPRDEYIVEVEDASEDDIVQAFTAPPVERIDRAYSLDEIRQSEPLRERMRRVDLDTVTFDTGSWELPDGEVDRLAGIAKAIQTALDRNPNEVFLVEGHTDAVGSDEDNLSLSDRRAETVATILARRFGIAAENLTTQGYGEQFLKVKTDGAERQNRRVTIRRITPLLKGAER